MGLNPENVIYTIYVQINFLAIVVIITMFQMFPACLLIWVNYREFLTNSFIWVDCSYTAIHAYEYLNLSFFSTAQLMFLKKAKENNG